MKIKRKLYVMGGTLQYGSTQPIQPPQHGRPGAPAAPAQQAAPVQPMAASAKSVLQPKAAPAPSAPPAAPAKPAPQQPAAFLRIAAAAGRVAAVLQSRPLAVLLAAAVLLRAALALATTGYTVDTNCFFSWGLRMAQQGPAAFYAADYFCDYPPGYLYVLGLIGVLLRLFGLGSGAPAARLLLVLPPVLADCALAYLCYRLAVRWHGRRAALWFAAAVAFCPVLLYDTAVWKQIDSPFALLLALCFCMLEQGARRAAEQDHPRAARPFYLGAAALYGLALAVKPQALLAGPVLALCFLLPFARTGVCACLPRARKPGRRGPRAGIYAAPLPAVGADLGANLITLLGGVVCALAPLLALALPFYGVRGLAPGLLQQMTQTTASYPYASVNAFNLAALLGGNWASQAAGVPLLGGFVSWQQLGIVLLVLLTLLTAAMAWQAAKQGRFSPLLYAAYYLIGVFVLGHRMHERYLVPGVLLLLAAAAFTGARRLLALAGGFGLAALVNLAAVYTAAGGDDQFLAGSTSRGVIFAISLATVALFALLTREVWRMARAGAVRLRLPVRTAPLAVQPQPCWQKREALALAATVLLTAAVSFARLGSTKAPQQAVDANGGVYLAQLTPQGEAASLWVYPGICTSGQGSLRITDNTGAEVYSRQLDYRTPFAWVEVELTAPGRWYLVELRDAQMFELAFCSAAGEALPTTEQPLSQSAGVTGAGALCDEPALVPQQASAANSFYFDEIYHARTGYELLHGMPVYETTHPPLGKDFIALGIALFGMTAFGWRFFGTLFGVLLVPLAGLFVRRLTRRPWAGLLAAALCGLDHMRFAQSRLATIDSYVTFFILLGAYCMLWYAQKALTAGIPRALLPMALGGAAFGLGCAAKWTGLYAGAGLAVLYFGVLAARWRQLCAAGGAVPAKAGQSRFGRECAVAIAGGVAFYVALPLAIYLASYLPYRAADPGFGLAEWWACQRSMLRYHANLQATHPFASSWYAWLLNLRPVWYYQGAGLPAGQYASIAGLVGPVAAYGGGAAMLWLLGRAFTGRGSRPGGFVLVCYLASLLPWLLVTRCTFLYHYFPCVPFLVAALCVCLVQLERRRPRLALRLAAGTLAAALALFIWFYPVLSGLPVGAAWAASLQWLPSWGFYILP